MQVDKESHNSEYWYLLGKSQIYMEPEKALESFNKAIKLKRDDALFYFNKGIALGLLNENEEAIKAYNKAIKLNPDNPDYIYIKGATLLIIINKLIEKQQFEKATGILRDKIFNKIHDNYTKETLFTLTGICLFHRKKYQKALIKLNQALTLNPESSSAINFKLRCLKELGFANNQLPRNINNIEMLLDKALSLLNEKKIEESERFFRRIQRLGIKNKELQICYLFIKAIHLSDQNKYYEALASINEALEFKIEYEKLNLYRHKAVLLNLIRKYKEAMDCCNYDLKHGAGQISERNRGIILAAKAFSYASLGDIEEAKELVKILPPELNPLYGKEEIEEKGKLLYFPSIR
ncbi:tetratricopeptide repeat protein [Rickettsia felis]|uniref:TPR repeats n=2 Tax=Rickettsia felis TaxID=42862 RepID=Q4UMC2_RICFE|nr:tetratricopeptide repeat protein [Rickettsia felis]AAY61295.1 TPR repeats [Rickettsia felis URRWXCal2]MDE8611989.1 tetratricopeptide repeat protein [Rickettsia felis]